ncbi:MAG: L-aspartate oxidase [Lachnospiraceae bacterium]|nr:L-aspartate oxidase [Lachnospiraceae bacterium]
MKTDILIAGCGCSGLYCALSLPRDKQIVILSKSDLEESDSFLAQGGICMLSDESDYESYFEDTMAAGHWENDEMSVAIMIRSSQGVIKDLLDYGVSFAREEDGGLAFTKEGAHSRKRILFHEDITGREITSHLLQAVQRLPNVTILTHTTLLDIICRENVCYGGVVQNPDGSVEAVEAAYTVLATGGIGGLYRHSTNDRHLTGDAVAMAMRHDVALRDIQYIQIHPTTLYSGNTDEKSFLISESVRGEGAKLYDKHGNRFVDELLPRDLLTEKIRAQMQKDGTEYVWEDLRPIPEAELRRHFPNIIAHCKEHGYDVFSQCIPVVPAQHYFMGGIRVDHQSRTSMDRLYAVGETACNGVHGKNRLASNSLLESLAFAKRAADEMTIHFPSARRDLEFVAGRDLSEYQDAESLEAEYRRMLLAEVRGL